VLAAVATQKKMLRALWPLLKPGGQLIYMTCSVFKDENEGQMLAFIREHDDASADEFSLPMGVHQQVGWQILPGDNNMDGFYFASLLKAQ